jgi:WD40 repeat protein
MMPTPLEVFCCYARKDQRMLEDLKKHLMPLQRSGLIRIWSDTNLNTSQEWEKELHQHLESADLILLLISPDFMSSEYCYSTEMARAIERQEQGSAHVIPILLRSTFWYNAPFAKLQMLPTNTKPVKSWSNRDDAFNHITEHINRIVTGPQTERNKPSFKSEPLSPLTSRFFHETSSQDARDTGKRLWHKASAQSNWPDNEPQKPTRERPLSRRTALLIGTAGTVAIAAAIGTGVFVISHPRSSPSSSVTPPDQTATPLQGSPGTLLTPIATLTGHTDRVLGVSWSPDGKHIASASSDETVRVWEWNTNNRTVPLIYQGHNFPVLSVAWSPNSKQLVSSGGDQVVQVCNVNTNDIRGPIGTYESTDPGTIFGVSWSPDGAFIADGGSHCNVWNASGGPSLLTYRGHSMIGIQAVAWSPDSKRIASAGTDATVQVWNASDGRNIFTYDHATKVLSVAWSPDGTRIASASADGMVQVWDARDASVGDRHLLTPQDHSGAVYGVSWSPNGQRLASANHDGTVRVWDASTPGNNLRIYQSHSGEVYGVSWSPDSKQIAAGISNGTVQVWQE